MKNYIDVCNGDADGLCALVQWRLATPQAAQLVTGLKRDIALLQHVSASAGDEILVCDLSLRRNLPALMALLERGVGITYFDHHEAGNIPLHPLLESHIDLAADTCTSLLIDHYLKGEFRAWALVGAYGDNLEHIATGMAIRMGLSAAQYHRLQALGESLNYNAYGDSRQDLLIDPEPLYRIMIRYADPMDFLRQEPVAQELDLMRHNDLQQARQIAPHWHDASGAVYLLPDAPWSRRIIGSLGNALALAEPGLAHALLKPTATGDMLVSVRAPLTAPYGTAALCRQFGGDGRAAAGGIDQLPAYKMEQFIQAFSVTQWCEHPTPVGTQENRKNS
jgi:hypothetical protein